MLPLSPSPRVRNLIDFYGKFQFTVATVATVVMKATINGTINKKTIVF